MWNLCYCSFTSQNWLLNWKWCTFFFTKVWHLCGVQNVCQEYMLAQSLGYICRGWYIHRYIIFEKLYFKSALLFGCQTKVLVDCKLICLSGQKKSVYPHTRAPEWTSRKETCQNCVDVMERVQFWSDNKEHHDPLLMQTDLEMQMLQPVRHQKSSCSLNCLIHLMPWYNG